MIYYYSGCGNSRWVAQQLGTLLNEPLLFIPDELRHPMPYHPQRDECLGFIFPVYAWAPPAIVLQFVEQMRLVEPPKFVFMVCTCGDDAGKTDRIFARALRRRGLGLDSAYSVIMPETYINLPGFQLDSPEGAQHKIALAKRRVGVIAQHIARRQTERDLVRGKAAWLKSHPVKALFNALLISDRPFHVTDNCMGCGTCEQVCPVHNIKVYLGRPQWQGRCIGCMACYHHCPVNAIQFGRFTQGKGQYYFKEAWATETSSTTKTSSSLS